MKEKIKKTYKSFKEKLKHLKRNINYIHDKSGKSRFVLFFDIIWCNIRYGISNNEYRIFEFYNISGIKRETYLSISNHRDMHYLYNKKIKNVLEDKLLFNRRFKDYLKRDITNLKDLNFKSFEEYAKNNNEIIARSNSNSFNKSYKKYNLSDYRSPAFLRDQIIKDGLTLVEKRITQHKDLNDISDFVTINVISIYHKGINIISSSIKFKEGNKITTGFVDYKTGIIKGNLKDEKGLNITDKYDGLKIPYYSKIIDLTKKLSKEMEEIKEIEWSFAVGSRGTIYLLDGNRCDDLVFAQLPEYSKDKTGLYPVYKNIFKRR